MPGSRRVPKSSSLQKFSEGIGHRFNLTNLVIIYTRFGSYFLDQGNVGLHSKNAILKKDLTYLSNTKGHYMQIFTNVNASVAKTIQSST